MTFSTRPGSRVCILILQSAIRLIGQRITKRTIDRTRARPNIFKLTANNNRLRCGGRNSFAKTTTDSRPGRRRSGCSHTGITSRCRCSIQYRPTLAKTGQTPICNKSCIFSYQFNIIGVPDGCVSAPGTGAIDTKGNIDFICKTGTTSNIYRDVFPDSRSTGGSIP